MRPQLNHTILSSNDPQTSAQFVVEILGFEPAGEYGPFLVVETGNGVSLDFMEAAGEIASQHYAFLVTEGQFDEIFGRIQDRGIEHWADPGLSRPGAINTNDGGRGVYFKEPGGHLLEILTRPYGSGPQG